MPQLGLNHVIRIEAAFGSEIQRDVSMKILREFLEAWQTNVQSAHKKNRVTIDFGEEPHPN